ncbi:hypothetical protein LCGC14_2131650 [marine sediment metagenome]|uniref:Uncharacterized protein n=1 Tax=marine sediment metagenome TaxID=412755 RepID=A0A0F9E1A2_9ZZZZ
MVEDRLNKALLVVLMCLPHQKARYLASDMLMPSAPRDPKKLRWLVKMIDAADPEDLAVLDPHFDLQRARHILLARADPKSPLPRKKTQKKPRVPTLARARARLRGLV